MYIHHPSGGARLFSQGETIEISGISQELAIVILVLSVLSYALVNSIEIAIVALSRIRVRHLVEQGSAAARASQRCWPPTPAPATLCWWRGRWRRSCG